MKLLGPVLLCLMLCGCLSLGPQRERALERVAKDWSQVIRASQVIPVYPLNEDLLPGDVFLVQTTVDQQQAVYRSRGFLPIDPPFKRLRPSGYEAYYHDFKLSKDCADGQQADTAAYGASAASSFDVRELLYNPACLAKLPQAAFPTYSFEVGSDHGFGIALPLQAVNLGLNLTSSLKARGSVAIQDAYTFGVDIESLMGDLRAWSEREPDRLKPYHGTLQKDGRYKPRAYLRVVNRVFVARALDVHLASQQQRGGKADAGVNGLPLGPLVGGTLDRTLDSLQGLDALNCKLAGGSPVRRVLGAAGGVPGRAGGALGATSGTVARTSEVACRLPPTVVDKLLKDPAVKDVRGLPALLGNAADIGVPASLLSSLPSVRLQISSFSNGSVGMRERFERPLAIGYIGFDVPIDDRGRLGPAVPSIAVLERDVTQGSLEHVEIDLKKADWDQSLDMLLDVPQPYAVATETVSCLSLEQGNPQLLAKWQRSASASMKPNRVHGELRKLVAGLVKEQRVSLDHAGELLGRALAGRPACRR